MVNNDSNMFFDKEDGLNSSGQFANVTISGDWAFCKQTGIRTFAFASTRTTSATIPNTVTTIGAGAFAGCTNLADLTLPNCVQNIKTHASGPLNTVLVTNLFEGCTNVKIHDNF
jgi:hypothetical protein